MNSAVSEGVMPNFATSIPTLPRTPASNPAFPISGMPSRHSPDRYGLISRRRRRWISSTPPSSPACETRSRPNERCQLVQRFSSFFRRMMREIFSPQASSPSVKRSVVSGIAISTVKPLASTRPSDIHDPSQDTLTSRPSSVINASCCVPSGLTAKRKALRRS